jgi:hypothetical protein
VALAVILLAAAVELQAARERAYPAAGDTEASLYLRSGTALRRLTGAYNTLAADVYWIRAIQYYGGTKHQLDALGTAVQATEPPPSIAADAYPLLYPLLDITTSLDPRFNIAYRFGATFAPRLFQAQCAHVAATLPRIGFAQDGHDVLQRLPHLADEVVGLELALRVPTDLTADEHRTAARGGPCRSAPARAPHLGQQ